MSEIRDKVREKIVELVKRAIMDYNQDPNPECAFDYYVPSVADQILSTPELAIVDRDAELQKPPYFSRGGCDDTAHSVGYHVCQQDMLKAGYVLEIKNDPRTL